jgi:uncharacterized protein YajQ (UPF0234 family)
MQVWVTGADGGLRSERRLHGHTSQVWSLAGWQDKVASGSDNDIRVWDVGTGAHDATLAGHSGPVSALVVHGDRLLSASQGGTIRAWAVRTWAGLWTVEAWGQGTGQYPVCLAVSGSKLVSGLEGGDWDSQKEVRVWGLEELELQQTLPQPAGSDVMALVAVEDLLRQKATKRDLSLKIFDFQAPEPVGGNRVKQVVNLRKGLSQEIAKALSKTIRDELKKVTVAIQGDSLRITGKNKDDLQQAIQLLRAQDVEVPLQFENYR